MRGPVGLQSGMDCDCGLVWLVRWFVGLERWFVGWFGGPVAWRGGGCVEVGV